MISHAHVGYAARVLRRLAQAAMASFVGVAAAQSAALGPGNLRPQLDAYLRESTQALPGEVSFSYTIPAGVALPSCEQFSVAPAPGSRTMGRTSVLIRCPSSDPSWSLNLPVEVRVTGVYLIATRQLGSGQLVEPGMIQKKIGDLGSLPLGTLTDPALALGRVTRSPIQAGQPVREHMLRQPDAVRAGEAVRVTSGGTGFQVSTVGTATNSAAIGERVRVRLANGALITAVASGPGVAKASQ